MISSKKIRRIFAKTYAIAEKNLLIEFRFKYDVILRWFIPIITLLMPIIVLDKFFDFDIAIAPWTSKNYMIFIFTGYIIMIMQSMITYIPKYLLREKYWKTLPALITAPFNRFYLLFGYILSEFIGILVPFTIFFVIMLIFFPLSIPTIMIIILLFFGIGIVFSGLGLFLGVFAISNENLLYLFEFSVRLVFWFSCVTYPFLLFPIEIQNIIRINPIYYLIDLIRLIWLDNNFILTVYSNPTHAFIFISSLLIFPIMCVYIFNIIFKKLGIRGY